MTTNDRIILDEVLRQKHNEVDPGIKASDFFELFTAEQILKDFDLSYDEIESGLVGAGGDGGIDGFYILVNGELVHEDPDYSHLKKNIVVEVILIQSKMTPGFQETPVERFLTASDDIFDLSKEIEELQGVYNENLVELIARFRAVNQQLAARFPKLQVSFYYASKGHDVAASVERKVVKLRSVVKRHFPSSGCEFEFLGASRLLELARRAPQTTYPLILAESPISSAGKVGFVCLVRVRDYFRFITDDNGVLRRNIFEANVRDYQGRTEVNDDIQISLKDPCADDFWWLNNGVSILASKASLGGKTLTIEDPQVVNGLQTSTEVYNSCSQCNTENDDRNILVRVIVPEEEESRDRIIKATNSQTAVQQASLRATDKIHRDIEEYLRPKGLFYDRRKNFYKNDGKPRDKIVGIPHLAQSVMSIALGRPDTARGRPSSLLKKDADYLKVYSTSHPIELYHVCAEVMRRTEAYLKSTDACLPAKDRNNLRFYVAMHAVSRVAGRCPPTVGEIARIDLRTIDDPTIEASTGALKLLYESLGGTDRIAKGPQLLDALTAAFVSA